ncbi:MAG: glycerophosphodiester phosphodiesterase family protein [Gammaproteobacteria bacterium]|jgi:glycerophosphoryl diester phosphodiesterase
MRRIVAHRGQRATFPENTLEGIRAAIRCGARAVEFDVQMSADHVPVVSHDANLLRTAGIDMDITQHSYEELKQICVGEPSRFAQQYTSVRLPTLEAMVEELLTMTEVLTFVELKDESIDAFGLDTFLYPVIEQLRRLQQQCIVMAENLEVLLQLQKRMATPIGWILHRLDEADFALAKQHTVDYLVINQKYCPAHYDFPTGKWKWIVYETRNPDKAVRLFEQGVSFVETNDVCQLLKRLPGYK